MKKIFATIAFIAFALCISTVYSYAETNNSVLENIGNSIRNTVGGAENVVEGTAKDATDAAKKGTNTLTDGLNNATNNVKEGAQDAGNAAINGAENAGNAVKNGTENMMNGMTGGTGDYTASRTAADGGSANTGFMSTETWSWIIIGVVAIAIIALFWYYAARSKNDRNHHN